MARDKDKKIMDDETIDALMGTQHEPTEQAKKPSPRKATGKKPIAGLQLNIIDYEDYLYRMVQIDRLNYDRLPIKERKLQKKPTVSQYILNLIEKDMKERKAQYDSVKNLPEFTKPPRVPKHTKNK